MPGTMTDAQLAQKGRAYKKQQEVVEKANEKLSELKAAIIDEMTARGTRTLEHGGITVKKVQQERLVYDEDEMLAEMTVRQRRAVLDEHLNLNLLPPAARKAVVATLREHTTAKQRKLFITKVFNKGRLARAQQEGIVPIELVERHSHFVKNAAYPSVTGDV